MRARTIYRAGRRVAAFSDRSPDFISTSRKTKLYALDNSRYFNRSLGFGPIYSHRGRTDSHTFSHSHHCDRAQLSPRPPNRVR
jgi:hypothetical protein